MNEAELTDAIARANLPWPSVEDNKNG